MINGIVEQIEYNPEEKIDKEIDDSQDSSPVLLKNIEAKNIKRIAKSTTELKKQLRISNLDHFIN